MLQILFCVIPPDNVTRFEFDIYISVIIKRIETNKIPRVTKILNGNELSN